MPAYLHSLLRERVPTRTLRSLSRPLLDVTSISTLYDQRAFRISAPNTWNSLPVAIQLACSLTISEKSIKHFYSRLLSISAYLRTLWHIRRFLTLTFKMYPHGLAGHWLPTLHMNTYLLATSRIYSSKIRCTIVFSSF